MRSISCLLAMWSEQKQRIIIYYMPPYPKISVS